jgi:hypothetical protein
LLNLVGLSGCEKKYPVRAVRRDAPAGRHLSGAGPQPEPVAHG